MDINDITRKANKIAITDKVHQLSADDVNCIVDEIKALKALHSIGKTYNFKVQNLLDGLKLTATKGKSCELKLKVISQSREGFEDLEDTGEQCNITISVQNSANADYVVVKELINVDTNIEKSIDVKDYLVSGSNQIVVTAKGKITEKTDSLIYTVTLTSLSLSAPTFNWETPFNSDIVVPYIIEGNVSKILNVKITSSGYTKIYEYDLGTSTYSETPYNCTIPFPNRTGVFKIEAYLTNKDGSIKTDTISYNVICYTEGSTSKLFAFNNVSSNVTNWKENDILQYTCYDGGNVSTGAIFTIIKDGKTIYKTEESSITTGKEHTFKVLLEVDTLNTDDFNIQVSVTDKTKTYLNTTIKVSNSMSYGAQSGFDWYINPKNRNNRQSNREMLINEADSKEYGAEWSNFTFDSDAWTTDSSGNAVLRLFAGQKLNTKLQPYLQECALTGRTLEFDYLCDNITDNDEPIIQVVESDGDSFVGFKIFPNNIIVHSSSLKNTDIQSIATDNGVRLRVTIGVVPNVDANVGFNICYIAINGVKVREFCYSNNDYFANDGYLIIGSDNADVDIYGIRMYKSGLTTTALLKNYINWLPNNKEKDSVRQDNDILDEKGKDIDFTNTADQCDCFTFDKPFPSKSNPSEVKGTLKLYFFKEPKKNLIIQNVTASGQGTSSKKYWEWNIRWKTGSDTVVITADGTTTKTKKVKIFDDISAMNKITAKKNWASSMQTHKCGSVNSYTDLWRKMGMSNEASENNDEVRISVYQVPMVGFYETVNEEGELVYVSMGMFTFGPDKGDAGCFGYDASKYPNLISIEGSDNAPLGALFRVPWNPNKPYWAYNEEEEAWQYNNTNCWDWDFSDASLDNIQYWQPAYNVAYKYSNRIKPFDGTIGQLNARVDEFKYSGYEYWTSDYNLWYYEAAEGKFIESDFGEGQINLKTQLGISPSGTKDAQNEAFIQARIAKFREEAPTYWDIEDALFHNNWVEFFAGTDQRAKNTYPYSFGGKWKWRTDDTDTILPVDNQGQLTKPYYIEMQDYDAAGAPYWNGVTSNFWNLLELAFKEEKYNNMRKMMQNMETLSGSTKGSDYDKLYAFYEKYYLSVRNAFNITLYNADSKRYESAKRKYITGEYTNDTDPITQQLGDAYSTESAWIKKRIVYMMSKYNFGLFSANGNDQIIVRAAGNDITYDITPAIDMYPTIQNGTSLVSGTRTKAGETCTITVDLGGSKDQQNGINAANYLLNIGDWYNKNVQGTMVVKGKMLKELNIGSKTEPITIAITQLSIAGCYALQKANLSRVATLSGELNLKECSHIKEVYLDGTNITNVALPSGAPLTHIEYSDKNQYLMLNNFRELNDSGIVMSDACKKNTSDVFIQNCPNVNAVGLIQTLINIEDGKLKRIRATGIEAYYEGAEGSQALDDLAKLSDGTYQGLDSNGYASSNPYPALEGYITINASCYEDSVNTLRENFPQLVLDITGEYYLRFNDKVAQDICVNKWGDGVGVTKTQLGKVTDIGTTFQGTGITNLYEGEYFNIQSMLADRAFKGCSKLKNITLRCDSFYEYDLRTIAFWGIGTKVDTIKIIGNLSKLRGASLSDWSEATNVDTFIIDGTVGEIGDFHFRGFSPTNFYLICKTPPTLSFGWGDSTDVILYVPAESLDAYKAASNYSKFTDIRPIYGDLEIIGINLGGGANRKTIQVITNYLNPKGIKYRIMKGTEYADIDGTTLTVKGNGTITLRAYYVGNDSVCFDKAFEVIKVDSIECDTIIDYAIFDGNSYIDLGYLPTVNTKVEIKFNVTNTNEHSVLGRRTSNGATDSFALQHLSKAGVRTSFGSKQISSSKLSVDTDYIVSINKTEMVVNGTSYNINQSSLGSSNYTMYLGNLNNGGTPHSAYFTGKICYLKIWESGELKMNLIPLIKDNEVQFKDTVSGTYYTNKGTGKLT